MELTKDEIRRLVHERLGEFEHTVQTIVPDNIDYGWVQEWKARTEGKMNRASAAMIALVQEKEDANG